jgi:hypothetical protein
MIDSFLTSLGFKNISGDPNLYFKFVDDGLVILLLYVDDIFLTCVAKLISECKRNMASEFEMKDLTIMNYFLCIEVCQRQDEIFLNQGKYAMEILKRFEMLDCKEMTTPMVSNLKLVHDTNSDTVDFNLYRKMVGSLMYLMNMRLDICIVVNTLIQYMEHPS